MNSFSDIELTTARLTLRPLRVDEAEGLLRIYSDAEFTRYWSSGPWTSISQAVEMIEKDQRELAAGNQLRLGILLRDGESLVGTCSLFHLVRQCRRAELGYGIAREHWRQGYMFEAVSALLELAFADMGLNRIEADVDPRNTASTRSLEKLGFTREGHLRERWIVGEEISDSVLYGLLAREWRCAATPIAGAPLERDGAP